VSVDRSSWVNFWPPVKGLTAAFKKYLMLRLIRGGSKVVVVELKHIDLPQEMQRAMAKQARG
jgi:regulator of protease activity HflC (stomatin/prohibitin superfamily)